MKRTFELGDEIYKRFKETAQRKGITVTSLIKIATIEYCDKDDARVAALEEQK